MYLVLMVSGDRVIYAKAFRSFFLAEVHADNLVMDQIGGTREMPNWENSEYRTVFTTPNGISIMIEPCEMPEPIDPRFQCHKYGVNLV